MRKHKHKPADFVTPCVCGGTEEHWSMFLAGVKIAEYWLCEQCGRGEVYWSLDDDGVENVTKGDKSHG